MKNLISHRIHTMGDILVELLEEQVKKDEQRNIESTDQRDMKVKS